MNTVKSFWVGWGSLCVAGGAAYFFAKKSINADRQQKYQEAEEKRRRMVAMEEQFATSGSSSRGQSSRTDVSGSPSQEANTDPAPTRHAPESDTQRVLEKSKYEASEPYKARKGDRFS